ncbi:MAG: hypothetical protein E6I96_05600 [Chloroflexi bacterium]|nr:MAG: hypothetical protein E6I96_05600 [Chloroflexota bacterium]
MRSRTPKVLHPLCGRPMVDWVLETVKEAGVKDVKVIANPHHADVAAHLDARVELIYQREPKGTAHALRQIPEGELRGRQVLVVNGDSPLLTAASVLKVIHAHQEQAKPATIASVEDPTRDDGRIIRAADGSLEKIVERKDATSAMRRQVHEFNVGLYCFDGSRLAGELEKVGDDNKAREFYLTEIFLHLRPVTVVKLDDPDEAMGVKDRVRLAKATDILRRRLLEQHMLSGVTIVDPDNTFIDAAVSIGQDTVIEPFTIIKGDTQIGSECRIGPHVYIEDARIGDRSDCGPFAKLRPGTELAEDVHIGSFAELGTWATPTWAWTPTSARVRLRPISTARTRTGLRSVTAHSWAWTRCWSRPSNLARNRARGPARSSPRTSRTARQPSVFPLGWYGESQ